MGSYTKNLFKRGNKPAPSAKEPVRRLDMEHLVSCAIKRGDEVYASKHHTHQQIRFELGDDVSYESKPGDFEGFMTSRGRLVGRNMARDIGARCGQCAYSARELLSSEVLWWPR